MQTNKFICTVAESLIIQAFINNILQASFVAVGVSFHLKQKDEDTAYILRNTAFK